MSRNHKDKYENSNPRRTHSFMSTEDANSGKKSYWPELEITGSIRNLSPNLWQLTHLTALYLNDNSLQRIPPEIGRLVNLRALDLSSNKLRSLPAELGDLIYLRYFAREIKQKQNDTVYFAHLFDCWFSYKNRFLLFQGVVIEPKLSSRVTVRTRKVVPVTSAWTTRKSTQQRSDGIVWRACRDEQAADVYVGQLTR